MSETSSRQEKSSFFRQSGWLMTANITAGILMWAVHFLSKLIPESEYGVVGTLFALTMVVPVLPLQMIFAQQTAMALATGRERQLARMIRRSALALFLVWLVAAGLMAAFHRQLLQSWEIDHPAALWLAILSLLGALTLPALWGLLQGKQDFFSLGTSMILSGGARLAGAVLIVLVLGGYAAGIMSAVLLGFSVACAFAIHATRDLWAGPGEPFRYRELVRQVVPLMLGFGACQILFTADTMFVKAWFSAEDTAFYVAAGTLSRALMWLVLPLAAVMFPKLVHSSAKAQQTDLLAVTLLGTGALAIGGALGLWLLGPFAIRLVYTPAYVAPATALLPWYAGAVVPLAMGNVLVNSLLARGDYRPVPGLVLLAIGFIVALNLAHATMVQVLQILATCNTLFLLLCVAFTWLWRREPGRNSAPV